MPPDARVLCWICNRNEANSGEHKTKRSDLAAVLGKPTQDKPFYFHDLERRNKPVGSLNAKILKAPIRICPNAILRARNRMIAHGNRCRTHSASADSPSVNGCGAIEFSAMIPGDE
jgi:hypothetical protein